MGRLDVTNGQPEAPRSADRQLMREAGSPRLELIVPEVGGVEAVVAGVELATHHVFNRGLGRTCSPAAWHAVVDRVVRQQFALNLETDQAHCNGMTVAMLRGHEGQDLSDVCILITHALAESMQVVAALLNEHALVQEAFSGVADVLRPYLKPPDPAAQGAPARATDLLPAIRSTASPWTDAEVLLLASMYPDR